MFTWVNLDVRGGGGGAQKKQTTQNGNEIYERVRIEHWGEFWILIWCEKMWKLKLMEWAGLSNGVLFIELNASNVNLNRCWKGIRIQFSH